MSRVPLNSDLCAFCGHARSTHDTEMRHCVGNDNSCRCIGFDYEYYDDEDGDDYDYRSDYDDDN